MYQAVDHEEAVAIANLGAQVYVAMKDRLYETWASSMAGDDAAKAELWRQEGRQAMLESMNTGANGRAGGQQSGVFQAGGFEASPNPVDRKKMRLGLLPFSGPNLDYGRIDHTTRTIVLSFQRSIRARNTLDLAFVGDLDRSVASNQ